MPRCPFMLDFSLAGSSFPFTMLWGRRDHKFHLCGGKFFEIFVEYASMLISSVLPLHFIEDENRGT